MFFFKDYVNIYNLFVSGIKASPFLKLYKILSVKDYHISEVTICCTKFRNLFNLKLNLLYCNMAF